MSSHADWSTWVEILRRYKLDGLVSWFLDAGSPLGVFGAQALYITQPFFRGRHIESVARMLEDEEETQAFAKYLRGEENA